MRTAFLAAFFLLTTACYAQVFCEDREVLDRSTQRVMVVKVCFLCETREVWHAPSRSIRMERVCKQVNG